MGLLADAEAALRADDQLHVVGFGDWSTGSNYVQADLGGSAEGDESLTRADITVRSVTPWRDDPQPQASRVWNALKAGKFMPQRMVHVPPQRGPQRPDNRVIIITAASVGRWNEID